VYLNEKKQAKETTQFLTGLKNRCKEA